MIEARIVGSEQVIARIQRLNVGIAHGLTMGMTRLLMKMQTHVKANKLSGQVLRAPTGNLRNSIHYDDPVTEGGAVIGRLHSGKEAPYARIHEYGGRFTIPAHQRTITKVFGMTISPRTIDVRSYIAKFPERSFMRTTLAEHRKEFRDMVKQAVANATAIDAELT